MNKNVKRQHGAASRKNAQNSGFRRGFTHSCLQAFLLVVLAFVEGDSAWKALHDVLFGPLAGGSFVLGAGSALAVQYTWGESLLPKIFKLVLGLVFAAAR